MQIIELRPEHYRHYTIYIGKVVGIDSFFVKMERVGDEKGYIGGFVNVATKEEAIQSAKNTIDAFIKRLKEDKPMKESLRYYSKQLWRVN